MRIRFFPKILAPPLSWIFWTTVVVVVLALYGGAAIHWFFDGPGHRIINLIPELKGAFVLVVLIVGGGLRLIRRAAKRREPTETST